MDFEWEPTPAMEVKRLVCNFAAESPDRAENFVSALDGARKRILLNPELPREIEPGYRKCRLDRFPYSLIYVIEGEIIWVIAFVHNSRHHDYWKRIS